MSLVRPILNAYLRYIEKPRLARTENYLKIRKSFEFQARWFFRTPKGTQKQWLVLEAGQRQVEALEVVPQDLHSDAVLFYIHGGAFIIGSPNTHSAMLADLCRRLGARALLPRYRLAPEHPYPAAAEDVMTAWQGLLASGANPAHVFIGGDSAGGQLALGLLSELCTSGQVLPAGVFCLSPLTDMRCNSDSFRRNRNREVMLTSDVAGQTMAIYLDGHPAEDPRVSPQFAGFPNAPPTWICVGDTELLYDDARLMAERLNAFGADVTLVEAQDLPHVWPMFKDILPEARQTLTDLTDWIRRQPAWPGES
ncbi:MAG: alpha/beta hydrolase [Sulfitobacter sp.]|nr:alpha/beta hydrolase [Sulfitobacter sp.]